MKIKIIFSFLVWSNILNQIYLNEAMCLWRETNKMNF